MERLSSYRVKGCLVMRDPHPVAPGFAVIYHGFIGGMLILGVIFHLVSAWAHYKDLD